MFNTSTSLIRYRSLPRPIAAVWVNKLRANSHANFTTPRSRWLNVAAAGVALSSPLLFLPPHDTMARFQITRFQLLAQQILLFSSSAAQCAPAKDIEDINIGLSSQFEPGELYEIKIHGDKDQVLIANIDGKLFCTGNSCSHYSAPLHRGIPSKSGTVQCPWHSAEFDLKSGKCVGGCGLKGIPTYPIKIQNDHVFISVPVADQMEESVDYPMVKRDRTNQTTFGIVGAGAAALSAAETLRQEGFTGRILMFGAEPHPPYDRPVLSKNLNAKIPKLLLRTTEWLNDEASVEFHPNTKVKKIDVQAKQITTEEGKNFKCDKILVAAGGVPRRLPVPGSELKNIEVLRSYDDMLRIAPYAQLDKNVVVVGSSFIGMEVAGALAKGGAKVTVVGQERAPFMRVFGEKLGKQLAWIVNQKNVIFKGEVAVTKFHGRAGSVTGVELNNGEILQADLVLLGIGVSPNTGMVVGIERLPDQSLKVNPFMQLQGCPDVYAAGDLATFPYYKTGEDIRVEHWNVALQQGRIAAKNMMGKMIPYDSIPFFWTMLLGKSIRYSGHCVSPDEIVVEGSLEEMSFAVLYIKDGQIQAVATCGKDPAATATLEAMKRNLLPNYIEYQMGLVNTDHIIHLVKSNCGKI